MNQFFKQYVLCFFALFLSQSLSASITIAVLLNEETGNMTDYAVAWNSDQACNGAEGAAILKLCSNYETQIESAICLSDSSLGHCLTKGYYVVIKALVDGHTRYGMGASSQCEKEQAHEEALANALTNLRARHIPQNYVICESGNFDAVF